MPMYTLFKEVWKISDELHQMEKDCEIFQDAVKAARSDGKRLSMHCRKDQYKECLMDLDILQNDLNLIQKKMEKIQLLQNHLQAARTLLEPMCS